MLEVKNLCVSYGTLDIVKNVSFTVRENQWLMIVGPNGAGKSTIVHALSQGVDYRGSVRLEGADIARLKPAKRARALGILAQQHHPAYSFTVKEVVRLGRYAHKKSLFSAATADDEKAVEDALEATGMSAFQNQNILTLSGGELQRTFLAQTLAQNPRLLILDEPTNHLDMLYQKQILELIGEWVKQPGRAVISVMHDLSLAKKYGSHALLLYRGNVIENGTTNSVLTKENLQKVYQLDVQNWLHQLLKQWEK